MRYVITFTKCEDSTSTNQFGEAFMLAMDCPDCCQYHKRGMTVARQCGICMRAKLTPQLHIVKVNFSLWERRTMEVNTGRATLIIRAWMGEPQKSKLKTLVKFDAGNPIGLQKLYYHCRHCRWEVDCSGIYNTHTIAANNGLSTEGWQALLSDADRTRPLALIHLTGFRY